MQRIKALNITKRFVINAKKHKTALSNILEFFSKKEEEKIITALNKVSCIANAGEILGIIGDNGSGKSTLLRVLAGIYLSDEGTIQHNGKIISLINLSIGLQDRLTMKENIFLCCTLFGLSQAEIKKKYSLIIKFSELEKFIDTKVYQFSNGMLQRLAFAIAIHCNPDILLLDEVFEIGDESFRKKSEEWIQKFVSCGGAVILASHELTIIEKYCTRVLWLKKGTVRKEGKSKEVIDAYLADE